MAALERIRVSGYKSIHDMDLELDALNVLIGANGAGKSNLISLFVLVRQMIEGRLQLYVGQAGGAGPLLHMGHGETTSVDIGLDMAGASYECRLVPSVDDALVYAYEVCRDHADGVKRVLHMGDGHRESQLFESISTSLSGDLASYVWQSIRSWRIYHLHDTSPSAKVRAFGELHDNSVLRPDASNLAAYLYMLRETQPESYERILGIVRMAAPFFDAFILQPSRLNPERIRLEWRQSGSDAYLGPHALSDGTLRFICLVTLLETAAVDDLILIDEPELGLHPYAITLLADMLRRAAEKGQLIVSTQSVTLVNQLDLGDIIVVDRVEGASVFSRPNEQALRVWLDEYGVGDIWEKNLLAGRPA